MKEFGTLGKASVLVASLTCAASAGAEDGDEMRGTVHVQGWVSPLCYASTPEFRPEGNAAEPVRLIVTLKQVCNQGGHQIWLDSAAGIEGVSIDEGASLARISSVTSTAPTLVDTGIHPASRDSVLVVELGRQATVRHLTLRVRPIL